MSGGFINRVEDLHAAGGFDLLAAERIASLTIHGAQPDCVVPTERSDGPGEHSFATRTQAYFAGESLGERLVFGMSHEAKLLVHSRVRQNVEKGRLLELDFERLLKSFVKDRLAGGVEEVRKHDRVFR